MIATEQLRRTHQFVGGNKDVLNATHVDLFDPHVHTRRDNSRPEGWILKNAARAGLTSMVASNHDVVTFDETRRTRDRLGVEIDIFPGTEMTVLPLASKEQKHVLVFGRDAKAARAMRAGLSPLMSMFELVPFAERHDLLVAVAHPLLRGISFDEKEIEIMQKRGISPHLLEIHNGGASLVDRHKVGIQRMEHVPLPRRWRDMLPVPGTNAMAQVIYENFGDDEIKPIGGSDDHNGQHALNPVNAVKVGQNPIDAAANGDLAVMKTIKVRRYNPLDFIISTIRGTGLSDFPTDEAEIRALLQERLPEDLFRGIYAGSARG